MRKCEKLSNAIGDTLFQMRRQAGLSQDEFGAMVETDRTTINKIEHGKMNLTVLKLCVICEKAGITLKDFFSDERYDVKFIEEE